MGLNGETPLRYWVNSGSPLREIRPHVAIVPGNEYWVDPTNGSDTQDGKSQTNAFLTLTQALSVMVSWDTVYLLPGGYTGNFATPINSVAAFCSIIGINATDRGFGPWMAPTTQSSPILEIKGRGWRITGIEFDNPTSAAGIKLTTSGTSNANYTQIDNCLFTGGKYAIDWSGAPTYTKVYGCIFDGLSASGATAFVCSSSATDVPRACQIEDNHFLNNLSHINMNPRGFKGSVIRGNVFQRVGMNRTVTGKMMDLTGGGKNMVVANYLGVDNGTGSNGYDESGGLYIAVADDRWEGNYIGSGLTDKNPGSGS